MKGSSSHTTYTLDTQSCKQKHYSPKSSVLQLRYFCFNVTLFCYKLSSGSTGNHTWHTSKKSPWQEPPFRKVLEQLIIILKVDLQNSLKTHMLLNKDFFEQPCYQKVEIIPLSNYCAKNRRKKRCTASITFMFIRSQ